MSHLHDFPLPLPVCHTCQNGLFLADQNGKSGWVICPECGRSNYGWPDDPIQQPKITIIAPGDIVAFSTLEGKAMNLS